MQPTKGHLTSAFGTTYKVARLIVPYWMDSHYRGGTGTRRQRIRIKKLAYALHGWNLEEEYSDTTPSPPTSAHEEEEIQTDAEDDDSDSEPDSDEVFGQPRTARNSSTRDDLLDDARDDDDTYPGPQYEDMRKLRQMLREKAAARAREQERREETDADPDREGPGPAAPRSPMRGLPTQQMQPPPHHHPPPGTPRSAPQDAPTPIPGVTLRSGLTRDTLEEQQAIAQRKREERQAKRAQAKLARKQTDED